VSATSRPVYSDGNPVFSGMIQTDAAINPGNSGGALLDINGKLIGINTAIRQKAEGIGFAIPVNDVKNALKNLLSIESAKGLWLGITVSESENGVITVSEVDRDSPAEKAGLKKGDVIGKIGGKSVASCLGFYKEVMHAAEEEGDIAFEINGQEKKIRPEKYGESLIALRCGLKGMSLTRWSARRLKITAVESGVLVSSVLKKSPAEEIGIEVGDVIVKFGENKVTDVNGLITVLKDAEKDEKIPIVIVRGSKVLKGELTAR
jgi:serine protease Do